MWHIITQLINLLTHEIRQLIPTNTPTNQPTNKCIIQSKIIQNKHATERHIGHLSVSHSFCTIFPSRSRHSSLNVISCTAQPTVGNPLSSRFTGSLVVKLGEAPINSTKPITITPRLNGDIYWLTSSLVIHFHRPGAGSVWLKSDRIGCQITSTNV